MKMISPQFLSVPHPLTGRCWSISCGLPPVNVFILQASLWATFVLDLPLAFCASALVPRRLSHLASVWTFSLPHLVGFVTSIRCARKGDDLDHARSSELGA